ncbi:MAG: SulP family inorganic anion transporter [Methylacidiphilales bacterium]|nr:SulP family inorganic anion transporter [Candidatus Methylacidiphilales bacterium]
MFPNYSFSKANIHAGIAVGLVNVPLSIAIAVASGATPEVGIITSFWAGLLFTIFGSCPANVVGTAAAISGVLGVVVAKLGPECLPTITLTSSALIAIFYFIGIHRYCRMVSYEIILGVTIGIAGLIALGQSCYIFGFTSIPEMKNAPLTNFYSQSALINIFIFVIALTLLFILKLKTKFPGAILIFALGVVLGYFQFFPDKLYTLKDSFGTLTFKLFILPKPTMLTFEIIEVSMVIAFICIIDTVLSAKLVEQQCAIGFDDKKELKGLTVANIFCALTGGIPATASFSRSSFMGQSGATDKSAGILNVGTMVIISAVFFYLFSYVPMVIIAAILFYIALTLIDYSALIKLFKTKNHYFWILISLGVITYLANPLVAIIIGVSYGWLKNKFVGS